MTTLAELVDSAPAPTHGIAASKLGAGWRYAVELADPLEGSSVQWYDITGWVREFVTERGADEPLGRARAMVATLDIVADDDRFAPWNEDTSGVFGSHIQLGAGLLIRASAFRVSGGNTVEWEPTFTGRVESWGDSSIAIGQIRVHRVVVRDLMTGLVNVPVGASNEGEGWYERAELTLSEAGWEFGFTLYGAVLDGNEDPILPMPEREEQPSAINELDVTFDPAGLVWRTNRKGQLIAHPMPGDTFHADEFTAGATGTPYVDPTTVVFAWNASTAAVGAVAYVNDESTQFGFEDDERGVINHVHIEYPEGSYDDDAPTSVQRYGRRTFSDSWIVENDDVADVILNGRAFATLQARPMVTSLEHAGFWPDVPRLDVTNPVRIIHATAPGRAVVTADARVRSVRETVTLQPFQWEAVVVADVEQYATELSLLPVEDLAIDEIEDQFVSFTWTNPDGQPVEPTETWIRMRPDSLIWQELPYPMTGMAWVGLTPDTSYEFDVRLVRRVDGLVTNVSPVRTVEFTTPDAPWIDDDGNLHIPEPDPGCHMEWELQSSPDGEDPWTTEQSGESPTGSLIEAPPEWYDAVSFWRLRTREVCGGTPGEWWVTPVGVGECRQSPSMSVEPFDDESLVCFVPEVCQPARIIEAVSQIEGHRGSALATIDTTGDGDMVLVSADDYAGPAATPVAFGTVEDLRDIVDGDATISCDVNLGTQPDGTVVLWAVPGIEIIGENIGDGWRPGVRSYYESGLSVLVGTELDLDTDYRVMARYARATGTLELLVDGAVIDDTSAGDDRPLRNRNKAIGVDWIARLPEGSRIWNCAAWAAFVDTPQGEPAPAIVGSLTDATFSAVSWLAAVTPTRILTSQPPSQSFALVDISNPASPSIIATRTASASINAGTRPVIQDGLAYFATGSRFQIVDVSSDAMPSVANINPVSPFSFNVSLVTVKGNYAFAAGGSGANSRYLMSIDVSNPASPSQLDVITATELGTGGSFQDMAFHPTLPLLYIAIATGSSGNRLVTVDYSNPSALAAPDILALPGTCQTLKMSDDGVLFATFNNIDRVVTFDLTDPDDPQILDDVSSSTHLDGAMGMELVDGYAFVCAPEDDMFSVVDGTDPQNLQILTDLSITDALLDNDGVLQSTLAGNYVVVAVRGANTVVVVQLWP